MNSIVVETSIPERLLSMLQLLRPKQWVKNGFVLAPLVFSAQFTHIHNVMLAIGAALIFCIASSATYIMNDIHDIENDRQHPKKSKTRPLASGQLSIKTALFMLGGLYLLSMLSWFAQPKVFLLLQAICCLIWPTLLY